MFTVPLINGARDDNLLKVFPSPSQESNGKVPWPLITLGGITCWMQANIACISGSEFCIDNNKGSWV